MSPRGPHLVPYEIWGLDTWSVQVKTRLDDTEKDTLRARTGSWCFGILCLLIAQAF